MVPLIDLSRRWQAHGDEVEKAVARVLDSGTILLGPELEAFETEFAAYCGYDRAVGVASGTEAIRLALVAAGVGPGDEVVVPALTAVPTAAAVCAVGAVPVPADVDPETAGLDPASAASVVSERTKAIVPVHLYGRPVDIDPFLDLGPPVIEDAAQAHGAVSPAASFAVAYSFYPTKNLGGVGDGGAVVTADTGVAAYVRRLRVHGMVPERAYVHDEIATNSRMSEIEAAALRICLGHLDAGNARRREIARRFREAAPHLTFQADHPRHVYHLCVVRVPGRDAFRDGLSVRTGVHYPLSLVDQPAYRHLRRIECPVARAWAAECVTLPCFPEMTDEEIDTVCEAIA
ncbi:MAG: DegT/DnrJ/EryC1/StrS family aminotransferase [Acidimicrobiia bacterium]|nr:DegT/DnrJ/EryC1/StrS family aminotransferase [Acidimicrobiia bacterium]